MATPEACTYEFDQVTVSFGALLVDGYAEGGGVTVEPDSVSYMKYVGADGKVTRTKTLNRCGKVRIRLAQSSFANDVLSAQHQADLDAPNGAGISTLYIRDRSGRSIWSAAVAWIEGFPSADLKNETSEREWVIDCAKLVQFVAGN